MTEKESSFTHVGEHDELNQQFNAAIADLAAAQKQITDLKNDLEGAEKEIERLKTTMVVGPTKIHNALLNIQDQINNLYEVYKEGDYHDIEAALEAFFEE